MSTYNFAGIVRLVSGEHVIQHGVYHIFRTSDGHYVIYDWSGSQVNNRPLTSCGSAEQYLRDCGVTIPFPPAR